ncbi:AGE family epimerase/isomerase [Marinilongibacter aquaticus]|uniref:AGE family epimerase/isomerase n=1 Tax=Marinilongibacter aquaticus TaxID=2975157 RepID=UPI0021BDC3F5|nr:AGE family epimerase/isomerase [Marinilongibacter aquaticus]UBM60838.1 AGE family epimerase/isomerase [Marinilongibacter aquaticus]
MTLPNFKNEVRDEFFNLLDFWINYAVDQKNGGFYGTIDKDNKPHFTNKSCVAISRILWGFSASIHFLKNHKELAESGTYIKKLEPLCKRAFDYLTQHFWDKEYGGVYWQVDAQGQPQTPKKQIYAHSFYVYGMSEYYRATAYAPAKEQALKCFKAIVDHAYDKQNGGYIEAYNQDWSETDDYILSKGQSRKSMNTHLHVLECFTNLYRIDQSESVRFHLKHCLETVLYKIIGKNETHQTLFFNDTWQPQVDIVSFGHDIEASWLILEAAEVLGDEELLDFCKSKCLELASHSTDGLQADGGMIYERDRKTQHENDSRDWWVMAEAMVGFYNAYQMSGKVIYLTRAQRSWDFIQNHLIDHEKGEWFGGVNAEHKVVNTTKASPWKAPYHNLRSCMEIYRRIG